MRAANLYIALALVIVIFMGSLRFITLRFVPGAEGYILTIGSILFFLALTAILSLLTPSARSIIKCSRVGYAPRTFLKF
jgi:hypothetical protein